MKVNQLKWGTALSYIQMALNSLIGLCYTPVMTRLLGQSEYGLFNTVSSTISMLSILSLGFGSSYIKYYAKYKNEKDTDSIYKLNGIFLIIFGILGSILLACGLYLSFNLEMLFAQGLTRTEYGIAQVLMILLTVNLALTFPASVFSHIILAHEKYIFLRVLSILNNVLCPLITLPLLLMGYRSIAMVTVTVCVRVVVDIMYMIYVFKVLKHRFIFHDFQKGIFKSLFIYTSFLAINIIVDQINWNVGKVMLGRFRGTSAVAIFSVGYTLNAFYQTFSTSISGVFTPRIHKIVNETRENAALMGKHLTDLFIKVGRIQFLVLALIASGLIFFGKAFIVNFWVGSEYAEAYYVVILLVIPAIVPLIQNIGIEIQRAQNKHKFRSIAYIIMAFLNIFATLFLCKRFGATGAAMGTAISLVLANGIIINIYYHKRCNIDVIEFWKQILRMSFGLIAPTVAGVFILRNVNLVSPLVFICAVLIYSVIYCASMWFISMNDYEKALITKPLRKFLRK